MPTPPRGTRTRLFRAIVGLGLAGVPSACGGMTAAPASDAGQDATSRDALAAIDTGVALSQDATGADDSPFGMLGGPDADGYPGPDAGADANPADAGPDVWWIPPVQ